MFIINFFEYTLSGWLYFIWLILMLIFSLACLGVVGDKVSKKRLKELAEKRKQEAEEEYEKAHELVEKQIQKAGVDIVYDPTVAGAKEAEDSYQVRIMDISNATNIEHEQPDSNVNNGTNTTGGNATSNSQDNQIEKNSVQESIPEVVDLDKVVSSSTTTNVGTTNAVSNSIDVNANANNNTNATNNISAPVNNATPTPETDSTPQEKVPAVLVINDDGTSNV